MHFGSNWIRISTILGDPGEVIRVGRKGGTKVFKLKTFVPPFLPTRLSAPGSPRMDFNLTNLRLFVAQELRTASVRSKAASLDPLVS